MTGDEMTEKKYKFEFGDFSGYINPSHKVFTPVDRLDILTDRGIAWARLRAMEHLSGVIRSLAVVSRDGAMCWCPESHTGPEHTEACARAGASVDVPLVKRTGDES